MGGVAKNPTTIRSIRMPDDRWEQLGAYAEVAGRSRAEVINAFAAWLLWEKGAKLPRRLPAGTLPEADAEQD